MLKFATLLRLPRVKVTEATIEYGIIAMGASIALISAFNHFVLGH